MNILSLIGRESELFNEDIITENRKLENMVKGARFLVIGGSGSIGH